MHLSDLHVGAGDWQQDHVLAALLRDLPGLLETWSLQPQLLFVTGDVARHGQKEEYDGAFHVLDRITRSLKLDPGQHVFLVPGNHDVDWRKIGRVAQRDHASLLELDVDKLRNAVGELFDDTDEFRIYGKRLTEWCCFTERFLGDVRSVRRDRPWRSDVVEIDGLKIGVLSLCTVWASGDKDAKGRLLLGERQLHDLLTEARDDESRLTIALMHHPPHWLHDGEHSSIRARLEREVDLVLHGHVHDAHSAVSVAAGTTYAVLGAGAAYAGLGKDRYHGFSVGRMDLEARQLKVHHFTWSTSSNKWHADAGAPGADYTGRVVLSLSPSSLAMEEPREPEQEKLTTSLRQAVAGVYETFVFAGLDADGRQKHATFDQIFVPLQLTPSGYPIDLQNERAESKSRRLSIDKWDWLERAGQRLVVLGDPGSGKSTLTRYLAYALAAGREHGLVPVLLTVREWIARREGLLEMAARQATEVLLVRTDAAALARLCEQGQVVLIIDGIDEAADPTVRHDLRDRVHAFSDRFTSASVLVTSRTAGYNDAPLNSEFTELTIEPFDDDAIVDFVHRWYKLAKGDSSEQKRRMADDLLQALEIEPQAKALARSPLLATLIATVYVSHKRLPGERAKLFEMVIDLLLIKWPAQRGRKFELSGTVQQPMLERLALRLQKMRAVQRTVAEVLVDTRELDELFAEQLVEMFPDVGVHKHRSLAPKWRKWLLDDCGLLQEQQSGRVGFLHLSLMEYMAGRALLGQHLGRGYAAIAELVAKQHDTAIWRETLLLMLGSENKKRELGQAVVERLLTIGGKEAARFWPACVFGIAMLREGVNMEAEQREQLLAAALKAAPERTPSDWEGAFKTLAEVIRYSQLHGEATRAWLHREIDEAKDKELFAALTIADHALPWGEVAEKLKEHKGQQNTALTLLDFGPRHKIGQWARAHAEDKTWESWARQTPLIGILWRSLESIQSGKNAGAWIPAYFARTQWIATAIKSSAEELEEHPRCDQRRGMPSSISWSIGDLNEGESAQVMKVWLKPSMLLSRQRDRIPSPEFNQYCLEYFSLDAAREFSVDFPRYFRRFFSDYLELNLSELLQPDYMRDFSQKFSRNFLLDAFRYFLKQLSQEELSRQKSLLQKSPLQSLREKWQRILRTLAFHDPSQSTSQTVIVHYEQLHRIDTVDEFLQVLVRMFAFVLVEAHAGLVAAPGLDQPQDATSLSLLRMQNRWVYLQFTSLIESANKSRPLHEQPHLHALLLTYGLTQFQTTWEWPEGPCWRAWFDGDPPKHWLPAHVWHLVRSIQEPGETIHRRRADACLDDNDWPKLAEDLRRHTVVPTPSEVLALFDRT